MNATNLSFVALLAVILVAAGGFFLLGAWVYHRGRTGESPLMRLPSILVKRKKDTEAGEKITPAPRLGI